MIVAGRVADGVRLAVGTFTIVPVPAPRRVDSAVARAAILLGPLVGAVLGVAVGAIAWLAFDPFDGSPILAAALAIGALAYLTRGLHLDGLADVADGLGSRRRGDDALNVMRDPRIGALGTVTVVLVLLLQTTAAAELVTLDSPIARLALPVLGGRVAIVLACVRGVPAARPDGLGAAVAGVVPRAWALGWLAVALLLGLWVGGAAGVVSVIVGLAGGALLLAICVRRVGGITGDVLGACSEVATVAALVTAAVST